MPTISQAYSQRIITTMNLYCHKYCQQQQQRCKKARWWVGLWIHSGSPTSSREVEFEKLSVYIHGGEMVINLRLKCFAHAGGMTVIELWQHGKIEWKILCMWSSAMVLHLERKGHWGSSIIYHSLKFKLKAHIYCFYLYFWHVYRFFFIFFLNYFNNLHVQTQNFVIFGSSQLPFK